MALSESPAVDDRCDALHPLILGHEHSPRSIAFVDGDDTAMRIPVTAVLVHSPAGWFLLETGLNPDFARDPEASATIYPYGAAEVADGEPLLAALAARGVAPGDLAGVAVSHLHVDHAGGLKYVRGGPPVYAQRRELDFAFGPAGEPEAYWRPDWDAPDLDWRPLDGDTALAPGIDVISTPGHTPGHHSYRIRMRASGTWIFAVDAIQQQENLRRDVEIGWSAVAADAPRRRQSHDRLLGLAAHEGGRIVPGHCPETWPLLVRPDAYP